MKNAWLIVLFMATACVLTAQESFLRHYGITDGLPSSETYATFQDSKGYIWIASDMGASRFDGYNFKVYTTADGLIDNTVFWFLEDHAGRIWFYTFSGRLSYFFNDTIYGKDFSINERLHNFLGPGHLNSMQVDLHDTIWLATTSGLVKIIPSTQNGRVVWADMQVVTYLPAGLMHQGYITMQNYCRDSVLLNCYTFSSRRLKQIILPGSTVASTIRVFENRYKPLTMQFGAILFMLNSAGKQSIIPNMGSLTTVAEEEDSFFWISKANSGVQLFKEGNYTNQQFSLLNTLAVTNILKDREGAYWFTTLEDGVFYMPGTQFKYYNPDMGKLGNNQNSLVIINGKINLLTTGGCFLFVDSNRLKPTFPDNKWPLGSWGCTNTYIDTSGVLWLSTHGGIFLLNKDNGKILREIDLPGSYTKSADSRMLWEDRQKDIWSLNQSSLFKIDHQTYQVVKTLHVPSRAETICEDLQGNILIGTLNGLYRLNNDSFIFLGYNNSVFKNRFVDVKKDSAMVVGATRGAGMVIITADSVYQVTTDNGLRSNMCRSVFIDSGNTIWLATNNGLSSIRFTTHPFKTTINNFSLFDGLPSSDILQVIKNGPLVWVLTKKGMASFNPIKFKSDTYPPPVYITRLKIDNITRPLDVDTILSHTTNFIGIDFVGLTYKNAGRQIYKYMLQGYDTSWTYTTNTFVQFTKLPSGSYKFIVKCINHLGIESTMPAVYSFTINTPFYRKTWFSWLLLILFTVIIAAVSFYRVKLIRQREENKTEVNRKIANLELQALRAQMNPHFIFNCLNAIQDFILKNDPVAAKHYLSRFSKLIRKTLDNSRRQNIRLEDEIDFLNLYLELESMRFVDKFKYHIAVLGGIENQHIQIPAMVIQPFAENAVRHSRIGSLIKQGELNITFSINRNKLICVIDDNGIGLKQSLKLKEGQPEMSEAHALDIINGRIKSMNEVHNSNISFTIIDKSDFNPTDTGTRVEIQIPLD